MLSINQKEPSFMKWAILNLHGFINETSNGYFQDQPSRPSRRSRGDGAGGPLTYSGKRLQGSPFQNSICSSAARAIFILEMSES